MLYPGRSSAGRRRHSTGTATATVTREVSLGGKIERPAASAATSSSAPPPGPLAAPPGEPGVSFAGAFGVGGHTGALGGATVRGGASAGATGTAVGGTSVTPCWGTKSAALCLYGHGIVAPRARCSSSLMIASRLSGTNAALAGFATWWITSGGYGFSEDSCGA